MNIKKALISIVISITLIIGFTGCTEDSIDTQVQQEQASQAEVNHQTKGETRQEDSENGRETAGKEEGMKEQTGWIDNSKDIYKGVFLNVFDIESPEGLIGGGHYYIGSNLTGVVFGKYFFEDFKNDREVLYIGNTDGTIKELELVPENYGLEGAVLMAGSTAGSDDLVLYIFKQKNGAYIHNMAVIDHEGNCSDTIETDMDLFTYIPLQIVRDKNGNIYFWTTENGEVHYFVMDKEGNLIWEQMNTGYNQIEFIGLPSGEVAMLVTTKDFTYQLFKLEVDSCEEQLIIDMSELQEKETHNDRMLYVTCQDEDNIFYATMEGIYRFQEGPEAELLYLFRNHGIKPYEVCSMEVNEKGQIGIMYSTSSTTDFLFLEPTVEKTDIVEVPFVMSETSKWQYSQAIVSFNKKYPQYLITEAVYEDETQLLTELTAGKGPVLVDTQFADFEKNVKLWECLDEELWAIGQEDVLLDKIQEVCRIDGKQYGVVTEWTMLTFAGMTGDMTEWTHEQFIDYLKKHPEIKSIFADQSPVFFLELFFFQSMEKCPFWNIETDEVYFKTEEFKQLLEMAGRLAGELHGEERSEEVEKVKSGECLGEMVYLNGAESFSYYNTILGNEVQYIGFPGKEGSEHYISTGTPVTIRSSATKEQKQAAVLFLEYLISYEAQKTASENTGALTVRKDVLEEYLNNLPEETLWIMEGEAFEVSLDKERVSEQFMSLYEKAVPNPGLPAEVENILEEELQSYFEGQKTAEQVCSVLQNRMQLYLYEH